MVQHFLNDNLYLRSLTNITPRQLTNAPPYISNQTLHNDLHVKMNEEVSVIFYKRSSYVWKTKITH
ncbi:putative RNA-directed DNA polymerase [Aphis craccivora]|uniref:Putative RNA-directed DNA polymerase n=1 Tax=Aphis craccivora TaxID=307492 RepID=A0A6G0ZR64_APHCR|nr:putative RNA-directed DNA polymerase [Aphis craccivora]